MIHIKADLLLFAYIDHIFRDETVRSQSVEECRSVNLAMCARGQPPPLCPPCDTAYISQC